MTLCQNFQDPAEHSACRCGVKYQALAGGAVHTMVLRLPCFELSNRRGEEAKRCEKYEPGEHDDPNNE